ncbi:MAG: hypothetical protein ACTSVG_09885 [Alphaproteobacteria bacterium]
MAHANKVTRSIETPDGGRCVDLFRRADASFGFEEYRRDPEDGGGWFAIGFHGNATFATEAAALAEACQRVGWLALVLD